MPQTSFKALVKDYCSNCTFAGVHFIADDTKHWTERVLWAGLVVLSWYGSGLLIIAAWDAFVNNPISFGVETTYTDWDTKMPAVAVCESSNDNMVYEVSDKIWTTNHQLALEDALKEIVYFHGASYTLTDFCFKTKNPDPQCPVKGYRNFSNLVRSPCSEIISNCSYNKKPFECCEYFQPIETDIGPCFIINSIQTSKPNPYPMISNLTNKRGVLSFDTLLDSTMYTLGEDEVPSIVNPQAWTAKLPLGQNYTRHLSVKGIKNDALLHETSPEQRACLFYDENDGGLYPSYSYSACTVHCRKKAQLKLCGCNDHFMLGTTEEERCNISGMACLHNYSSHLTTMKPQWAARRAGIYCDCLPSCDQTDISIIKDVHTAIRNSRKKRARPKTHVQVILAYLPTERYKRSVVRSRLDLVVSVGSTTGLFVGASLLSFVELIFYFTIRYASNVYMERKRRLKLAIIKRLKLKKSKPDKFFVASSG